MSNHSRLPFYACGAKLQSLLNASSYAGLKQELNLGCKSHNVEADTCLSVLKACKLHTSITALTVQNITPDIELMDGSTSARSQNVCLL